MRMSSRAIKLAVGAWALAYAGAAGAQDNFDRGKSGAQLYASNCAICHKSAQKLANAGGASGLESFLREHYTASRESAASIAAYLKGTEQAPARARGTKRAAKGEEKAGDVKNEEKKPASAKATESKPAAPKAEKNSEPKLGETAAGEPKATKPKAHKRKASETAKPEKPE